MKVCIVVDDYVPRSTKVAAKMIHELSLEIIKQGHGVTVITPDPTLLNSQEVSILDGVKICRFYSGEIKNVSKVKRLINEYLLSYRAWKVYKKYFKENPHDFIIFWSPSIFWSGLVKNLKNIWNAPSYMLLRDFFPQWVIDNNMLKEKSLITRFFRYYEQLNYQSADIIALQSPKNIEWFANQKKTSTPLELLYNWASDTPATGVEQKYRTLLGLEKKVVFFYGGNIGHAQDMMNIVRLAKNFLHDKNAHFLLIGKGDEFELVKKSIQKDNLANISLLPAVSQEEFKIILSEFDVGLFSLHSGHTTHNFPGKLLAYMVQGMPILGSINFENDLKKVLESANAGFVSINGNDEELFNNAKKLMDKKLRKSMGKNSKQLLHDKFSVEVAAKTILKFHNSNN